MNASRTLSGLTTSLVSVTDPSAASTAWMPTSAELAFLLETAWERVGGRGHGVEHMARLERIVGLL